MSEQGPTLYVGDGTNDGPAWAAATVGIAFGSASNNVTRAASSAVVRRHGLAVASLRIAAALEEIDVLSILNALRTSFGDDKLD